MIAGEVFATFLGLFFTAIVAVVFIVVFVNIFKSSKAKQRMEQYKQNIAERTEQETSSYEQRRRQEELKQRLSQKYGRSGLDVQDDKHQKHVADSHEHGHFGEEEHYEEIIGSLGDVNDEGCTDLSGVRFIANDIAYEIQTQDAVDYDRIAQAMVLGEIINSPRFKTPYTRRK